METSNRVPCADHSERSAVFVCQRLLRGDAILVALLLALGIFSYWPNPTVADHVHADMWAYALPALNFLQGEGFVVIANGHKYPPVPTFGFPLLLSAAYATLGPHPGNGVYVVFLLGLVTIVLTYRIARMLFDGKVAVVACVLLAVAGQFRYYTKVIAPDGAVSASFCLASQVLLIAALRTPQSSLWTWALLGQTAGFAMTIRPDNVLLLLPVAVLLIPHMWSQNRAVAKVLILTGGILFWGMTILLANYLYTGDWFRTGYHVNFSALHDRVGGSVSWRYFLNPSFRESNFVEILRGVPSQWSLLDGEVEPFKRWFYLMADAFLAVGLVKVALACKRDREMRGFFIWSSLWILSLALFFSCTFVPCDARYMQRVVPYLCLFTAIGLVSVWDSVSRLEAPSGLLFRWFRSSPHAGLLSRLIVWPLRVLLACGFGGAGWYMASHPYIAPFTSQPQTAYLQHVNEVIPERNALIITGWFPFWMEHFLARDSQRTIVPLYRFHAGADMYVQWKRPPHPEWINEDYPTRGSSCRYKRMYENGAQEMYPDTAYGNPEVIDTALRSGRSVYLVMRLIVMDVVTTDPVYGKKWSKWHYIKEDAVALNKLQERYALRYIEKGWQPGYKIPEEAAAYAKHFLIIKVGPQQVRRPEEDLFDLDSMLKAQ